MLIAVVVSLLTHLVPPLYAQQPLQFPPTPKKAVSDEYHGVKVSEDYRWLEDIYDPAVRRWIDEQNQFGTVKDPEQFRALYAYSPYHNVKNNTAYPAVLFLTGDNDGRVDPMQSRKMSARLQAATTSGLPILLRTSSTAGHGIGTGRSERIAQNADVFAFLFDQLKMDGNAFRR
jgi:prolyl oligopeptidase PreP (S9A serine peptidase family)